MDSVSIISVPFNGGQPRSGVEKGPQELHNAGLISVVEKAGWKVSHDDTIPIHELSPSEDQFPGAKRPRFVGTVCKELRNKVKEHASEGNFVLTLGGDHSVATGSISGLLSVRSDTFVVWVDAHADINTPTTSGSGNIHGMPVALLAHLCGKVPGFEFLDDVHPLNLKNLAYIGLRDVDEGELKILADNSITAFSMSDVQTIGITALVERIIQASGNKPIHISFDVDGIDPAYMPATGTPVNAGLTLQDGQYICKQIANTRRLKSMDVVEVNPDLSDEQGKQITCKNSLLLVESALTRVQ